MCKNHKHVQMELIHESRHEKLCFACQHVSSTSVLWDWNAVCKWTGRPLHRKNMWTRGHSTRASKACFGLNNQQHSKPCLYDTPEEKVFGANEVQNTWILKWYSIELYYAVYLMGYTLHFCKWGPAKITTDLTNFMDTVQHWSDGQSLSQHVL